MIAIDHPCALMRSVAPKNTVSSQRQPRLAAVLSPAACYTFNPLSVYFCHRVDGALALLIYEVRNTFGDIQAYALAVKPDEISCAGVRQQQDKLFYVSPFIGMVMRYHFRVSPPASDVKLRILETDAKALCSPRPATAAAAP